MEENNFGPVMEVISSQGEQMWPFGDVRSGVANMHSWDLKSAVKQFGEDGVRLALGDTLVAANRKHDKTRRSQSDIDASLKKRFDADPALAIRWSRTNEELSIKALILNLAATNRQLTGGGPLTRDEALILSRKVGDVPAINLYNADYGAYDAWVTDYAKGDQRFAAGPGRKPIWLDRYKQYDPSVLL